MLSLTFVQAMACQHDNRRDKYMDKETPDYSQITTSYPLLFVVDAL